MSREALVDVSASIASRSRTSLERALRIARSASSREVDEVILQSHLFVGYPIALEAMLLWRNIRPASADDAGEDPGWQDRGADVCRTVYGTNYEKLRQNVTALHPDLDRWMVETGYGRVIGRPRLDLATRELCISALLAVWNSPRQLHSHLRGAANAGAAIADIDAALAIASRHLTPAAVTEVEALWGTVRESLATPGRV